MPVSHASLMEIEVGALNITELIDIPFSAYSMNFSQSCRSWRVSFESLVVLCFSARRSSFRILLMKWRA